MIDSRVVQQTGRQAHREGGSVGVAPTLKTAKSKTYEKMPQVSLAGKTGSGKETCLSKLRKSYTSVKRTGCGARMKQSLSIWPGAPVIALTSLAQRERKAENRVK